ncbi:isoprenylcysteine carboxylmethyltransferase ste14 [Lycorma delicatula]|uniref:isoprenylcysteine carboxylmethyltransferase ste14 n=1 Tax=Lycorma delicatula TaxID=130591 RepID=UPI003F51561E
MLIYYGVLSIYCFLLPLLPSLILLVRYIDLHVYFLLKNFLFVILPLYYISLNVIIWIIKRNFSYQVAVRAILLGFVFCLGLFVSTLATDSWNIFGWYMCILSFFHYSEFLAIAATNPRTLSISSYILNHSVQYQIAAVSSWVEFFIEQWLCPEIKTYRWISIIGLSLCVGGEFLRKLAMFTAKSNFNHVVQSERNEGHELVTTGVYGVFRHPSYVGWFYWSIGTQLILLNPVCFIGYTLASWKFFHERITVEEMTLISFFGQDYIEYRKKVPTGLPFINGYDVDVITKMQQENFQNPVT